MSPEIVTQRPEPHLLDRLTVNQKRFLFGFINLNIGGMEIDWDLDQTIEISEDPVKAIVDAQKGTNYFNRRVDRWNSISSWLTQDKILSQEEAKRYEDGLWVNNDVLMMGPPNEKLRDLSFVAWRRGIPQSVTTVRACGLRQTTYKWLGEHFWWIPKKSINIKVGMNPSGFEFKIAKILDMYKKNPNLIHVDDDIEIIKVLVETAPKMGIVGIKYPGDDVDGIKYAENRVFLEREDLNNLIYYAPFAEEMINPNRI